MYPNNLTYLTEVSKNYEFLGDDASFEEKKSIFHKSDQAPFK